MVFFSFESLLTSLLIFFYQFPVFTSIHPKQPETQSLSYSYLKKLITVQPWHLLVSIFMKTRSLMVPPYADLNKKALMQASLQHTFSFKPAHGWTVTQNAAGTSDPAAFLHFTVYMGILEKKMAVCYTWLTKNFVKWGDPGRFQPGQLWKIYVQFD